MTVYDATMFFNENDLYEIRLNAQKDFVDYFIVVEAGETHTGLKKPLNFDHERFAEFKDRIIYRSFDSFDEVIKNHPELMDAYTNSERGYGHHTPDWARDNVQGNYVYKVLKDIGAQDDDIVYVSCCDEIIKKSTFDTCKTIIENNPVDNGNEHIFMFRLWLYIYKFNLLGQSWNESDTTAMLAQFKTFKKTLPATLRGKRTCTQVIDDAGWHFGYMDPGGGERVLAKYKAWAHAKDPLNGKSRFEQDTAEEALETLFNWFPKIHPVAVTAETHPQYIVDNLEKFQNYLIDWEE